jgi:hypothetical protein
MSTRVSANHKGFKNFLKMGVILIVICAIAYSEVMYLQIIQGMFPSGLLAVACYAGALVTGLSVIALYFGKSHWFTPGDQLVAAWGFTAVEVAVLAMNDIVAFASMGGADVTGVLGIYKMMAPAVPLVALIGWMVITFLDTEQKERHADMEMESDVKASERTYKLAAHDASMEVKTMYLADTKHYLAEHMRSAPVQAQIAEGAKRMAIRAVSDLSGMPMTFLPEPHTVTGSLEPASFAQTGEVDVPDEVKKKTSGRTYRKKVRLDADQQPQSTSETQPSS